MVLELLLVVGWQLQHPALHPALLQGRLAELPAVDTWGDKNTDVDGENVETKLAKRGSIMISLMGRWGIDDTLLG